jgi:hypothetical protein
MRERVMNDFAPDNCTTPLQSYNNRNQRPVRPENNEQEAKRRSFLSLATPGRQPADRKVRHARHGTRARFQAYIFLTVNTFQLRPACGPRYH